MIKKILIGLLVALILIQFIRIDKTPQNVDPSLHFTQSIIPTEPISNILKKACYDCHSAYTNYPWYSNIAPISFWLKGHVDEGTKHLNFSKWQEYDAEKQEHKLEELVEMMENKAMPLKSYKWVHPEARLTNDEYILLTGYFKDAHLKISQ